LEIKSSSSDATELKSPPLENHIPESRVLTQETSFQDFAQESRVLTEGIFDSFAEELRLPTAPKVEIKVQNTVLEESRIQVKPNQVKNWQIGLDRCEDELEKALELLKTLSSFEPKEKSQCDKVLKI